MGGKKRGKKSPGYVYTADQYDKKIRSKNGKYLDREVMEETQEERIRRDIKTINKLAGIVKVSKEVSKEIVNEKGWIE